MRFLIVPALILLTACGRPSVNVSRPPTPATPNPHEEALIERTVRDRLAEENRITEQQLVNARAAASQRMVGRQMFMKLEEQYRARQEELSSQEAGRQSAETPSK